MSLEWKLERVRQTKETPLSLELNGGGDIWLVLPERSVLLTPAEAIRVAAQLTEYAESATRSEAP